MQLLKAIIAYLTMPHKPPADRNRDRFGSKGE